MPNLVDKAINNKETRHLSMVFSGQMARYPPTIGIIKLGILNHKHKKKPHMYRHGSYVLGRDSHPINKLVDIKISEPGTVLHRHCTFLWRIAGTFPNGIIDIYNNDVSGAFPQLTFHPELAKANVSLHDDKMSLEVRRQLWPIQLGTDLRCLLFPGTVAVQTCTIPRYPQRGGFSPHHETKTSRLDDVHTPVTDACGNFIPEFDMFVDDLLSATLRSKGDTDKLLSSSIDAVYIIIRYPGSIQAPLPPPTMAWHGTKWWTAPSALPESV